jgi:predicted ribosome quality control (RQC) complex YloA/Tae2 family protein
LLCHLGRLQQQGARGQTPVRTTEIRVINHYGEPGTTQSIPVDPGKSLQANAEAYFRTYRKAQRGLKLVEARLRDLHRQLEQHQALHQAVCRASDLTGLQALEAQILPGVDARRKAAKSQRPEKRRRRSYISSEGYEILVGQNASNNEEITFRLAAANDTWLHAADYAGSHVIIRNPSRLEVPAGTLLEAAGLAAFYSAARKQSRVEVRYTQRKFVHKLTGAAPGLVRLQNYKTLYVEPSRRIDGLGSARPA